MAWLATVVALALLTAVARAWPHVVAASMLVVLALVAVVAGTLVAAELAMVIAAALVAAELAMVTAEALVAEVALISMIAVKWLTTLKERMIEPRGSDKGSAA